MGSLALAVIITLAGAAAGAIVASSIARPLTGDRRERIARGAVTILGGAAGAQIAAQTYNVLHQLQIANQPVFHLVRRSADALALVAAFRGILLYGGALIALAAIVGLIGARRASDAAT